MRIDRESIQINTERLFESLNTCLYDRLTGHACDYLYDNLEIRVEIMPLTSITINTVSPLPEKEKWR